LTKFEYCVLIIMKIIINKINDVVVEKRIAGIACNNIGVEGY